MLLSFKEKSKKGNLKITMTVISIPLKPTLKT